VNVTGGLDMTLLEVDEAANAISDQVDPEANIIFGAAFDPSLDGKIRVSVVATGMDGQSIAAIEPKAPRVTTNNAAPLLIKDLPPAQPAPRAEPAPAPSYARTPPQPATPVYSRSTAQETGALRPSTQPASFGDPRRGAYEAPVEMSPPSQAARHEPDEVEQADLLAASIADQPLIDTPPAEIDADDSPMFVDQHVHEDPRHKRSGLLSLFGGRPRHEPPPPLRDFRNDPTPVLQARAAAVAQQPAPAVEEEHPDAAEDLEIPSFLRRLAN
jgi:cell division protein FtsZ